LLKINTNRMPMENEKFTNSKIIFILTMKNGIPKRNMDKEFDLHHLAV
jgi:hypothetical protein